MREVPHECQYCNYWDWDYVLEEFYCRCHRSKRHNDLTLPDFGCEEWEQIPWHKKEVG